MATGIMAILLIAVVLCFPVRVHAHVMKWHKLSWMPQKLTYRFYYRSYRNLVGLGPGAEPALEALIEGFRLETHPTGRRKYLDIFRAMGPAAEPVIPELIAELTAKRNVNSVAGVIESIGVVNPEVVGTGRVVDAHAVRPRGRLRPMRSRPSKNSNGFS